MADEEETFAACNQAYEKLDFDEGGPFFVHTQHGWFDLNKPEDAARFRVLHQGLEYGIDPTRKPK